MARIRVLIVDDHAVVRQGLRHILQEQKDVDVVGEARDGIGALGKIRELRPDIVLLDIAMPRLNGLDAIRLIKEKYPMTQIVVFSMHQKEAYVHDVLSSGALGYILKSSPSSDVLAAIRAAHRGEFYLSSKIGTEVIRRYLESRSRKDLATGYELLSDREQQVFRLLVEGMSTKEVAQVLNKSPKTAEKHRASIMKKLGIYDLVGLVKYAVKIGVVDPEMWQD